MSARRVLHVLGSSAEAGTAQARIVMALAESERYAVSAWFLGEDGPLAGSLRAMGIASRVLPVGDPRAAVRIARAVRAERPAIVHLHAAGRARLWPLRAAPAAKVVAHLHAARAENGTRLNLDQLVRGADAVIATSRAVASELDVAATVIHPGVPIPPQRPPAVPDGPPILGTVGRLEPVKGLGTLLEAFATLAAAHPELRVEIAGSGSCEPALRASAAHSGFADRAVFLGWQTDLAALHRRWRVFVQPSLHEGFGLAALEATAAGLPVVAGATGGLTELIEDGLTGLLFPAGDAAALADRLERLLSDRALAEALGTAGRRRAAAQFTAAAMVTRIEAVYARLLEK